MFFLGRVYVDDSNEWILCMNNKECVNLLNGLINNIGVKGFWFDHTFGCIMLRIPLRQNIESFVNSFGYWRTLDEMFTDIYSNDIRFILECIGKIRRDVNWKNEYIYDYMSINDVGVDFLECVLESGSLDEVKLKMQIRGYEI